MAKNDFIMSSFNLTPDQIHTLDPVLINGIYHIRTTLNTDSSTCPFCGGKSVSHGFKKRVYNHLPLFGYPSVIEWNRHRFKCKDCQKTFMEPNPFGPENYHCTYAVLNSVMRDLRNIHYTYKDIAEKHRISEALVRLYADSFIQAPRLTLPESLGMDEIHSKLAKYGGSYIAVLVDNVHRSLLDILPNRSKRTLSKYFESIPLEERKRVRYVTIDFWEPYKDVALKYLPNARICGDPFHVVKHLGEGFSRIRVDIMNQSVYNSPEYYLLKKWHRLLETDCTLDNTPKYNNYFRKKMNYRDLYNMLLNLNPDLSKAYQLKEMYRTFNKNCTFAEAPAQLDSLIQAFEAADLYCYREFVEMLKKWRPEIINSFERPFDDRKQSNALAEHCNSRLRELLAVSNGYANFERFRAKALFCLNNHIFYSLTHILDSKKRQGKPRGTYNKQMVAITDLPGNDVDSMDQDFEDE